MLDSFKFFFELIIAATFILCSHSNPVSAQGTVEEAAPEAEGLLGDWEGLRSALADKGISYEAIFTTDIVGNARGGLRRTAGVYGATDLSMSFSPDEAGWWNNGQFFFHFLGTYGQEPSEMVGDLQFADNIEAQNSFRLYEGWYEHTFSNPHDYANYSVLAGMHDFNTEFFVLDYAGTLINSSFGLGASVAQVPVSIYPITSLGLRLKADWQERSYVLAALYDGVPGDPYHPKGTHIRFDDGDGVFYALEGGLHGGENDRYFKLAIGAYYHSYEFEDFNGHSWRDNGGSYLIAERNIYHESEDGDQGLGVFFQYSYAPQDRNFLKGYVGAGLTYIGLIPGRDLDTTSVGFASARVGSDYRRAIEGARREETAFELTYRYEVNAYFSVQPDLQYILDPGAASDVEDALVLILRTEVAL